VIALIHTNEVFLAGYEAISDGILITDQNLTIQFFNTSGKHIFHLDDTVLNTQFEELVPGFRDIDIELEPFREVIGKIKQDSTLDTSFTFSCPAGEKSLKTTPLWGKYGEMLGRIWIITDTSLRG
jgi:hypothetical protein